MRETTSYLQDSDFPQLERDKLSILQVNLGYLCNQQCLHCHVNAGPNRKEIMRLSTVDQILSYLDSAAITTLDLTGGAPELNPHFRYLVAEAEKRNVRIIDRCNLTILEEPGQEDLAQFLAAYSCDITASLPCYLEENVNKQRGKGVFGASIRGLRKLNDLGYGHPESGLQLSLVYNPIGPELPPEQRGLESAYKEKLGEQFGIIFNELYTLANMPIKRFGSTLLSKGQFEPYMKLLRDAHDDANLAGVMCRSLISVDWEGFVYDCDFNQMLKLPMSLGAKPKLHISELIGKDIEGNPIAVMDHCYGCTAGQGSSCGGALV
jgi:radical SAM/Cys-rich protein